MIGIQNIYSKVGDKMVYGYARVSTKIQAKDENSLEAQIKMLEENGAAKIFKDSITGTKMQGPEFDELLKVISQGDTLIVCKLDRIARSLSQGSELINELIDKGIKVNILNIGVMDNTPSSKLTRNIFFAFAEYERDMIVERTSEGREIAKQKVGYQEGRPKKFSKNQIDLAVNLLSNHSYKQVSQMTGISKSTLQREKRKYIS